MTNQEAKDLQQEIMDACKQLQRQHPDWFFARVFAEVQRQHPEWFKDAEVFQETLKDTQQEMMHQKNQIARRQLDDKLRTFKSVAADANGEANDPTHEKEMVALSNQALQRRVKYAVAEIQKESPGLDFQDAYGLAKTRHPGLFLPDDAADEAEGSKHDLMPDDKRAGLAAGIMRNHPGTTFGEALDHLRRTRPEMFDAAAELVGLRSTATV